MGGFSKFLPFEACMTLVGLINLSGLPFSFGFFIKHLTLLSSFDISGWFVKVNLLVGMLAGLIYSYRLYYYIFFDVKKAKKSVYFVASGMTLQSRYYSNSTLASNLSITALFIVATAMLLYLYANFFVLESSYNCSSMVSDNNKIYFLITNGLESSNVIGTYVN
jgi:NADH:ubiquinone oxidoreductase subunit 5 (subunit L)/multisubunit Na+/H+ antiporter MnhA subunit